MNRIAIERPELRAALVEELRSDGARVAVTQEGELCYPSELAASVRGKLVRLDLEQRPPNQVTFFGGAFGNEVLQQLENAGIQYTYIERGDEIVVSVSQPDHVPLVSEIAEKTARRFFETE